MIQGLSCQFRQIFLHLLLPLIPTGFSSENSDIVRNERLTTVEEVSEPLSSDFIPDSLPNDVYDNAARFGSSGTASSDFQADSLPPDFHNGRLSAAFFFIFLKYHIILLPAVELN